MALQAGCEKVAAYRTLPVASTQVISVSASRGAEVTLAYTTSPACRFGRFLRVVPAMAKIQALIGI